jgi:probable rRNA maturation factor
MNFTGAVRVTASRTMILLDPDLDPDPAPSSRANGSSLEFRKTERNLRMPSVRALSRFLREAQAAVRLRGLVSVLLTTDAEIRRLNRTFRRKNKVTDVLSFPAAHFHHVSKSASQQVSGDLAISVETARRQAAEQGHSLAVEVKVLMLHGLLHLAGYDHETDGGQMARRERRLRLRLGLPLGLIERSSGPEAESAIARRGSRYPTLRARNRRKDEAPGSEGGDISVRDGSRLPALATEKSRKDGARTIDAKVGLREGIRSRARKAGRA